MAKSTRLDDKTVLVVVDLAKQGLSNMDISKQSGVAVWTVSDIIRGAAYTHVTGGPSKPKRAFAPNAKKQPAPPKVVRTKPVRFGVMARLDHSECKCSWCARSGVEVVLVEINAYGTSYGAWSLCWYCENRLREKYKIREIK